MGAKWSRALALLLCKEKLRLLEGLVLEVLEAGTALPSTK
jgi:hypothetical protein